MQQQSVEKTMVWYRKVAWGPFINLVVLPICGLMATLWVKLKYETAVFALVYLVGIFLCVTAGYHRLWSHRSYYATTSLRMALAIFGAAAMQGPIRWWAREHRAHHRFTDTSEDPYNIKKGFLHAHILWMIIRQPKRTRRVDISDLRNDPVVAWQEKYYSILAVLMGWIFPMAFAGFGWNDWAGGFLYGGILRMFVCHQGVFCINSVAHYYGDQPYDDRLSPRNIPHVMAMLTLGEGYHNFHHMFPSDYRNGVHWYDLDFTKWIIWVWGKLGLVQGLKRFRQTEIEKASLQTMQKELRKKESQLTWGPPLTELPVIDWKRLQAEVLAGRNLVCIEGIIHDVDSFTSEHPGGDSMIRSCIGKDASAMFNGGVYNHSIVARNILSTMRVAVLLGGCEVETLKEESLAAVHENGAGQLANSKGFSCRS